MQITTQQIIKILESWPSERVVLFLIKLMNQHPHLVEEIKARLNGHDLN